VETTHVLGIVCGKDAYIEAYLLGTYTTVRQFGWEFTHALGI
jgi:hypothetical protein